MGNIKIQIEGSNAYWEQNVNYPNNWTLEKWYYKMGKTPSQDRSGIFIYGWVHEVTFGENKGKIRAGHPMPYDEEADLDAIELGFFDTVEEAMAAVIKSNHPDYGIYC